MAPPEKTIFQKIMDREIPARIEYEDDRCMVIHDIDAKAPVHLLIVPRKLIRNVAGASDEDTEILGHLIQVARRMAARLNLESGFRLVANTGPDGGESVPHLHVHLLGGRRLKWPPG